MQYLPDAIEGTQYCCCCFLSLSHAQLFVNPWTSAHKDPLSSAISQDLLRFMSTELVILSNHLILYYPFLLQPSIFPSIRVFSNESALHGQSIGASVSASILPMNIQGLISFRIDWFDLLAVQGILRSLLQHHSLKASILWHSSLFMVQLSHLYMMTETYYIIYC